MTDEARWRRRFLLFMALRMSGLILVIAGMTIAFGDLLRPGGHLELGLLVVGIGLVDALLGPVLLRQRWDKRDQA